MKLLFIGETETRKNCVRRIISSFSDLESNLVVLPEVQFVSRNDYFSNQDIFIEICDTS